jgi:hypothetical protein
LKWGCRPKVGSLEKLPYFPGGGKNKVGLKIFTFIFYNKRLKKLLKIESRVLKWDARPKVGSLDYINHRPLGGDIK